jgi:hypothetical protein
LCLVLFFLRPALQSISSAITYSSTQSAIAGALVELAQRAFSLEAQLLVEAQRGRVVAFGEELDALHARGLQRVDGFAHHGPRDALAVERGVDGQRAQAGDVLHAARVARGTVEAGNPPFAFVDEEAAAVDQRLEDGAKVFERHRVVAQEGNDLLVHVDGEDGVEVFGGGQPAHGGSLGAMKAPSIASYRAR